MDWETDKKTYHDKLHIQGLEQSLDQICTWLARFFSAASGESSSKRYFTEKLLVTEACSDVSDAENRDPWDLPQPVPRASHARHTLPIEYASLVSASAGSLVAQP